MRKLLLGLALALWSTVASAQCNGIFPNNYFCGNVSGSSAFPYAVPLTSVPLSSAQFDSLFGNTQGSIIYRGAVDWVALSPGTVGFVLTTSGSSANPEWTAAGSGTVTSVTCGTGLSGGTITTAGTCEADIATQSNFQAGTADKLLDAGNVFTDEVAISPDTVTGLSFSTFIHARLSPISSDIAITCSDAKAGQAGVIRFVWGGTHSITSWCSQLKWSGGTSPTVSTGANDIDVLSYFCSSSDFCTATYLTDMQSAQ